MFVVCFGLWEGCLGIIFWGCVGGLQKSCNFRGQGRVFGGCFGFGLVVAWFFGVILLGVIEGADGR